MILALDIGGSNIRSANVSGTKISNYRKTPTPKRKKEILEEIFKIVESHARPSSIKISTAGFERDGIMQQSLKADINGIPLSKILERKFRVPVYLENDANCAALAEFHYGAGRGKKNFILLTLGTGIGGGAILDGKLYRGRGGAIEPGSMIIDKGIIFEELASGDASVEI